MPSPTHQPDRVALLRDEAPPPRIRSNRRKVITLVAAGSALALVLLLVILNIDRSPSKKAAPLNDQQVTELINPQALTEADLQAGSLDFRRTTTIESPKGGWIEQVDEHGRLKQQYRYSRSEALPAGLLRVDNPEVKLFLSDNRMAYLTGETALIKAPDQSLDEGRLTGNVVIRMFKIPEDRAVDVAMDTPILLITTHEAQFNNFQGEILCEGRVVLQTVSAYQSGRKLRLQINDKLKRPEWLRIDEIEIVKLAALPDRSPLMDSTPTADSPAQSQPARQRKPRDPSTTKPDKPGRTEEEKAARRAERARMAATTKPLKPEQFYRLTFERDVRIRQGDETTGWIATGGELSVVFSVKSSGLGDSLSFSPLRETPARQLFASHPMTLRESLVALTVANLQNPQTQPSRTPPDDLYLSTVDEVTITCTGGLTMTPEPADKAPKSPEESILELRGSPATMFSYNDQARVTCDLLEYQTQAQVLVLTGSTARPLRVTTPDFIAEGQHFTFDRRRNEGGFNDEGWLESVKGSVALLGPGVEPSATQPEDKNPPLRIAWNRKVDLRFKPVDADSQTAQGSARDKLRIDLANFMGDVAVTSDDFNLTSDGLTITFADGQGRQQTVREIVAIDHVLARSTRDRATLGCDTLIIKLTQSKTGDRTIPEMMIATGDVEAFDASQMLWTDSLIAKFEETDPNQPVDTAGDQNRARMARNGVQVVSVVADKNIQIRMNDGTRAFADQMTGNPVAGTVILTAENELLIASQTMIIDQGKRLELNRDQQAANWPSGGRARVFRDVVIANSTTRVDRPVINESLNPLETRAVWTESMKFDNKVNDGGGALDITGNVDAVSTPSSLDYSTMTGQSLHLEFARTAEGGETIDANPASGLGNSPQTMMQGKRRLNKMVAQGGTKMESRSWLKEDHSDVPRVFYIAGDTIWYNNLTLEAGVPGPGELLVRDDRVSPNAAAAQPDGSAPLASFTANGTTVFKWNGELRMNRLAENRYRIDMTKDVKIQHRDLNQQDTLVTATDAIQATVDRADVTREKTGAVDLGGSMELVALHGDGGVYIRTPQRDVSTDIFDYDVTTQMAQLSAAGDRTISITARGNPNVIKAQQISWDMGKDVITILRGSGTANR